MANRWQRRRRDDDDADAPDDERPGRRNPLREAPPDDDLEARLGPVPSAYRRPPTADELRAAFGRRPRTDDPDEDSGRDPGGDFASRYPTETLFVSTPLDHEPPPDAPSAGEDRSRTSGDYYYDPEDAWAVLGLAPGSSWKQITAAHRRLAMQHHPDRLLDATTAQRRASEETMRDVNVAYSVLRRLTGH